MTLKNESKSGFVQLCPSMCLSYKINIIHKWCRKVLFLSNRSTKGTNAIISKIFAKTEMTCLVSINRGILNKIDRGIH